MADLLARHRTAAEQQPPTGTQQSAIGLAPDTASGQPRGDTVTAEPLRRDPRDGGGARRGTYRAIGVAAGLVLVCGIVTASTVALSGPRIERAAPAAPESDQISGYEVFRPDVINASMVDVTDDLPGAVGAGTVPAPAPSQEVASPEQDPALPPAAEEGAAAPESEAAGASVPAAGAPADEGGSDPEPEGPAGSGGEGAADAEAAQPEDDAGPDDPATPGESRDRGEERRNDDRREGSKEGLLGSVVGGALDPVQDIVIGFYDSVDERPADAYGLLSPAMQRGDYHGFAQSWSDVTATEITDSRLDGANAAVVSVDLHQRDGTVLHTVQRVFVSNDGEPRIVDALLLSAVRTKLPQ